MRRIVFELQARPDAGAVFLAVHANEKAHRFREAYRQLYGEEPGWEAAFSRDAAMLVVEAARAAGVRGRPGDLATDLNYFNTQGDAMKPLTMGVFHKRNIISALTQFHPVQDLLEAAVQKNASPDGQVVLFGGRYMYKTNVVYTGIQVNAVSEVDLSDLTCVIDCHIWFRHQEDFDVDNIIFSNAVDTVEMVPVASGFSEKDHLKARLFHVKGRFRMDFLPTPYMFDKHILGFRFRHRDRSRNNLIYVTDAMGMGINRYGKAQLRYLNLQNQNRLDFSRFNFVIEAGKDRFSLRGRLNPHLSRYMAAATR